MSNAQDTKIALRSFRDIGLRESLSRWKAWRPPAHGRSLWAVWMVPGWHNGRGPYISIGLWLFAFGRGY